MTRLHPPAPESSLCGVAYRALREQIRGCELLPGELIAERAAAVKLGTGSRPVREALCLLAREGLVQRAAHGRYQVARPTLKSVDDLFVTWRLIGPEIARLGVREATGQQAGRLRCLISELGTVCEVEPARARAARFVELGDSMFDLLAVATTNDRMLETYRRLDGEMIRVWSLLAADPGGPGLLQGAHIGWQAILDDHDGDRAAEVAHRFIESSHAQARQLLQVCDVISLRPGAGAVSAG
jgi:DNA-binding GntR family transcriptional regulator